MYVLNDKTSSISAHCTHQPCRKIDTVTIVSHGYEPVVKQAQVLGKNNRVADDCLDYD